MRIWCRSSMPSYVDVYATHMMIQWFKTETIIPADITQQIKVFLKCLSIIFNTWLHNTATASLICLIKSWIWMPHARTSDDYEIIKQRSWISEQELAHVCSIGNVQLLTVMRDFGRRKVRIRPVPRLPSLHKHKREDSQYFLLRSVHKSNVFLLYCNRYES